MLVLSRKQREQIQIGDNVVLTILRVKGNTVRIGIEAPRDVRIVRGELPREIEVAAIGDLEPQALESKEQPALTDGRGFSITDAAGLHAKPSLDSQNAQDLGEFGNSVDLQTDPLSAKPGRSENRLLGNGTPTEAISVGSVAVFSSDPRKDSVQELKLEHEDEMQMNRIRGKHLSGSDSSQQDRENLAGSPLSSRIPTRRNGVPVGRDEENRIARILASKSNTELDRLKQLVHAMRQEGDQE